MPRSSMGIHAERTHLGRKRKTRTRYGAIAIPPGISKVTSGRNNSLLNAEISSITCLTLVCNSDRLLHHAHVLKCGPRGWRTKVQTDLRVEEGSKEVELTSLGRPLVVAGFALSISGRFSAVHRGPFGRLSVRWKRRNGHPGSRRLLHTSPRASGCSIPVLQATKDLRKVSLWLGHAHMQTTEMYTRTDPSVKLEALESMMPPKLRSGRFKATDKLIASLSRVP